MTLSLCNDCKVRGSDVRIRQSDYLLCNKCELKRNPGAIVKNRVSKQKENCPSKGTANAAVDQAIPVAQAASVVCEAQLVRIKKMNHSELLALRTNQLLDDVRTSMVDILPEKTDAVEIANNALIVHNKLKEHITNMTEEFASGPTLSQSIFLNVTPQKSAAASSWSLPPTPRIVFQPAQDIPKGTAITASRVSCTSSCQFDHMDKGKETKTVECSLCLEKFHKHCVGLRPSSKPAFWSCSSCKEIPNLLKALMLKSESHESEIEGLRTENGTLTQLVNEQRTEIDNLRSKLLSVGSPTTHVNIDPASKATASATSPEGNTTAPASSVRDVKRGKKTLLIGDSMIRDIDERGLLNTHVKCIRGGTIANVKEELQTMDPKTYEAIIIHIGTNNCSSTSKLEEGEANLKELVTDLNRRAPTTKKVLSTVCPRTDSATNQIRVTQLNAKIKQLAADNACVLVNSDDTFYHRNGDIDEGMLNRRGLHLSKRGTRQLLRNFNKAQELIAHPRPHKSHTTSAAPSNLSFRPSNSGGPSRQQPHHSPARGYRLGNNNFTRCRLCGLSNHSTQQCRHEHPVQCHDCKQFGHKSYVPGSRPYLCRDQPSHWQ